MPDSAASKGAMLSGIPNLSMTFGYVNVSWTLKALAGRRAADAPRSDR